MPGEEAYGKNDIVFACEGFLPLVLDPELVLEPQSWKLFNELKVQVESFFFFIPILAFTHPQLHHSSHFRFTYKGSIKAARKRLIPASYPICLLKACPVIQD